jgi:arylsulfatase B/arylsulfatase I/J
VLSSEINFSGYSSFYGFYSGGQDYFTHGGNKSLDFHLEVGERCGENCSLPQWDAIGKYSTTLFSERAIEVVNAHDPETPLFLYLAYQAVHAPSEVPESYKDAYNGIIQDGHRRTFAGMLSCADEGIGNVTRALDAKGMLEHTLLVFTTGIRPDHLHTPTHLPTYVPTYANLACSSIY